MVGYYVLVYADTTAQRRGLRASFAGARLCLKVAGDPVRTLVAEAVPGSVPAEIGNDQHVVIIDVLKQVVTDLGMVLVGHD
jgi:hypothetical protein